MDIIVPSEEEDSEEWESVTENTANAPLETSQELVIALDQTLE
jgi:hypothetical protein